MAPSPTRGKGSSTLLHHPGVKFLLGHLAANFAARVRCGVEVDVVLAGHEVGRLGIGQRGASLNRAVPALGIATATPAFLPALAGPWKCAAVAGPDRPL